MLWSRMYYKSTNLTVSVHEVLAMTLECLPLDHSVVLQSRRKPISTCNLQFFRKKKDSLIELYGEIVQIQNDLRVIGGKQCYL